MLPHPSPRRLASLRDDLEPYSFQSVLKYRKENITTKHTVSSTNFLCYHAISCAAHMKMLMMTINYSDPSEWSCIHRFAIADHRVPTRRVTAHKNMRSKVENWSIHCRITINANDAQSCCRSQRASSPSQINIIDRSRRRASRIEKSAILLALERRLIFCVGTFVTAIRHNCTEL